MPVGYKNPSEYNMDYENVTIFTEDCFNLHGWLIKTKSDSKSNRTILVFHGNAGNIGARLPFLDILVKQCNCNVLIVDYRGYGNSEGTPTEKGLELDANASLQFLKERKDIDHTKVYLFGRSLGGAVAV